MRAGIGASGRITLRRVADPSELEPVWRSLEAHADGSFFQSWSWIGCLVAERFPNAVLLTAEQDGRPVALALCSRRPTRWAPQTLWLGESGMPGPDSVFIEHNGPLLALERLPGPDPGGRDLLAGCLAALLHAGGAGPALGRRIILSGVDEPVLEAARTLPGAWHLRQTRAAPFLDLTALAGPEAYLASRSNSTRYQLRRSRRLYEASGPLRLDRAASVAEGLDFLDRLAALHQASWQQRGRPGAFAAPEFVRFHRALIATALPRDEIDLLRIAAGEQAIGYLYNFRWRGRVYAYQSGFDYAVGPQQKPGLTSHHLAIEAYRAQGMRLYDFLAGDDRYKTSLAGDAAPLHWLELALPASPRGLALRLAALRRRVRPALRRSNQAGAITSE